MPERQFTVIRRAKAVLFRTEARQRFLFLLLCGLLIRLVVMPFFCHADLLSEYRRVYMTIETGFFLPQLTRLVVYVIELATMAAVLPLLPNAGGIFYFPDLARSTAGLPEYLLFVSDPTIFPRCARP